MAVKLIANYAKRLGLPGYSSHQFSISVEIELRDIDEAAAESARLYTQLQNSVDQQIQETGFVPPITYGLKPGEGRHDIPANGNGNGHQPNNGNGAPNNGRQASNGNGHSPRENRHGDNWNCTDGQRGLILRVINENKLDKNDVEQMAQQLFGIGVKDLNTMQASNLIEDLLEKVGKKPAGQRRWSRQPVRQ